jgi:uncharacterized protein GlcG (DUF336 family)
MSAEIAEIKFHDAQDAAAPTIEKPAIDLPAIEALSTPARSPAATVTEIAVTPESLERLLEATQAKLSAMKAAAYVADNRKQAERQLDAVTQALANADAGIEKFERQIALALDNLDAAIEHQYTQVAVGQFGVPLHSAEVRSVQQAANAFVSLRQGLFQARQQRAILVSRLDDLKRVRAQSA